MEVHKNTMMLQRVPKVGVLCFTSFSVLFTDHIIQTWHRDTFSNILFYFSLR